MAQLINLITSKENWQTKINDPEIVKKWKKEAKEQNISKNLLNLTIDLLKKYNLKNSETFEDDSVLNWPVKLGLTTGDLKITDCTCKCLTCIHREYLEDEDEDEDTDEVKEARKAVCTCCGVLDCRKGIFLKKYTLSNNLVNDGLKNSLLQQVLHLQNSIPVDYHPNSNKQVVDIVHPSMYPYVKDVTKTKNKRKNEELLFQWLPSEFTVSNDEEITTTITSYINNLDRDAHTELYGTIEKIFSKFVPSFETLLKTMADNKKIKQFNGLGKCQVIVKLCNTVLTPDNNDFHGGSWHLEGLPDENIIATGIYYYKMDNITENFLNFRGSITNSYEWYYPQHCSKFVELHYGLNDVEDGKESVINLGKIRTEEDLCLVFPNFLQHQVSDFTLTDNTKPGTRNILVFFLIDPSKPILSTKDIKKQQNFENAKEYRELLMFERKFEINNQNSFYERAWSLCEH